MGVGGEKSTVCGTVVSSQPSLRAERVWWKDARAAAETVATDDLCLRAGCRVFELHRVALNFAVVLPCMKQRRQDVGVGGEKVLCVGP